MERSESVVFDVYPTFYFEPISSREEVKKNYYEFEFSTIYLDTSEEIGFLAKPTRIMISNEPLTGENLFAFTPRAVKNVTVGKLGLTNTTLYTGDWMEQTPYFVAFSRDGFYCCIYNQDIDEASMVEMLGGIDVIKKIGSEEYLPKLWTEY